MISAASVGVWFAHVDAGRLGDTLRASLAADLDDATLTRLDRFRRPEDRDRGLAAHALLRRLLAAELDAEPRELALATRCLACGSREHGKPYLDGWGDAPPAQFNLSHSGQLVAVAITGPELEVGVDVERRARRVEWASLRRSIFSDAEWEATEQASDPGCAPMDLWSRKEAAVKAIGYGLATPLRKVELSDVHRPVSPWEATIEAAHGREDVIGWDIAEAASVDAQYAAAIAVRAPTDPVRLRAPTIHHPQL